MESNSAAKRRRLDDATRALAKPFRSPFKTTRPNAESTTPRLESLGVRSSQSQRTITEARSPKRSCSPPSSAPPPKPELHSSSPSKAAISPKRSDPEITALLRTERDLEASLRAARTELDTLAQALKVLQSKQDVELEELVRKWKLASRTAAEEVFAKVRDRVNRMGGVGAWRERERKQEDWRRDWDTQDQEKSIEKDEEDDGNDKEEKSTDKEGRQRYAEECDMGDDPAEKASRIEEGQDDDTFTMDMMLRSLNIEPAVIGYDKEHQMWVD